MAPSLKIDSLIRSDTLSAATGKAENVSALSAQPTPSDSFVHSGKASGIWIPTDLPGRRLSFLSDIPPALLAKANILPPFLTINSLYRYLRSADGEITIGKIEKGYTQEDQRQYHLKITFIDRQEQQAGYMSIRYYPDPATQDGYQSTISLEMQKRGNYYGFELYVQLLRHDYANPKVTSHYLKAIDIGRYLWLNFDGFRLVADTIQQIQSALSCFLNPHDKMQATRDYYSPLRISQAFILPEPRSSLGHLARIAFADSSLSENERADQTRFPGKLALLTVERPIKHENDPEQLQYDAQLNLTDGNTDFADLERSIAAFWLKRNLPQRFAHDTETPSISLNEEIQPASETEFQEADELYATGLEGMVISDDTNEQSLGNGILPPIALTMGGMNVMGLRANYFTK